MMRSGGHTSRSAFEARLLVFMPQFVLSTYEVPTSLGTLNICQTAPDVHDHALALSTILQERGKAANTKKTRKHGSTWGKSWMRT